MKSPHHVFYYEDILSLKNLILVLLLISFFRTFGQEYPPNISVNSIDWEQYDVPQTLPNYMEPFIDPITNNEVTRISDENIFGCDCSKLRHRYAKNQAWNANGTLIMTSGSPSKILDGSTYEVLYESNTKALWSNTEPDYTYDAAANSTFVKKNIITNQTIVLHTFSNYSSISVGNNEGNLSNDDKYVALIGTSGSQKTIIVYDIENDQIIATKPLGTVNIDWVSMSQTGNYVVMSGYSDGSGPNQGIKAYDKFLNNEVHLYNGRPHGDIGFDTLGNEVFVGYQGINGYSLSYARLDNGAKQGLFPYSGATGDKGLWGGHISTRNLERPGWAYVSDQGHPTDINRYEATREIFAIKLDDSQTIERFAKHHTNININNGYNHQAHAVPNRDGSKVLFASNWDNPGLKSNSYPVMWVVTAPQNANEPSVNAGPDQTICLGESATITATGADSYVWDTVPVQTTASITVTPDVTTTYTVTGTDTGGNISTDSITVFVTPLPIANAGDDASICDGETITLTASGGTSYEWSTGQTTQSISVSPNSDTTYSVIVTQNNCQDSDEILVTVNPSPNANAGPNVTINEGENTTLTASGGDTYLWNTGETTASIIVSPIIDTQYTVTAFQNGCEDTDSVIVFVNAAVNANAGEDQTICEGESTQLTATGGSTYLWSTGETTATITVSPNSTTTYTVTVSNGNNSDSDEVTITVNPTPIANAGQDITINEGESTTLTATGGDTYLWSTGETTTSIIVSPIIDTQYSVTAFQNGCEDTDNVTVFVNEAVNANAGEDQSICEGESTQLTASGGDTYLWNTGETTATITVTPDVTTIYTVTVSDGNTSDSDDVIVNVNPIPIADAGPDVNITLGENITLAASGGDSYLWNTGETSQSIVVSPTESTTYSVTVSLNGCTDSDDVNVIVNDTMANAGLDQNICLGESTVLTATGGDTYLWNTGETTASITVSPNITTTYTVTVSTANGSDSDDVTVNVNAIPTAEAGPDQTICEGETVTLTASGGTNYLWSNGQTTQSIQVTPTTTSIYTVTVDQNGCTDEDSVTVNVNPTPIADAGEDVIINEGESITLTATGGGTYLWNTGETTQSIVVSPIQDTIYTVFVIQNQCEDFADVMVAVNPAANAYAGEDVIICDGDSTVLTATGGDSYLWSTGETTPSITVSPMATSNYTVIVSNDFSSDTDEVLVTVNPLPNVQVTNDVTILQGEFVTLSATGANSYLWSNGATQPNIAVAPMQTVTYSVDGYINNCFDTAEVVVNVVEPVEAYAGPDQTICSGDSITLTATGGDNYLWNTGETTSSISVNPEENTTYTVIVSNTLDSDAAEVNITVEDCEIEIPTENTDYEYSVHLDQNNPSVLVVKLSGMEGMSELSVHDIRGKLLYFERVQDNDGQPQKVKINTDLYSKGIYVITLQEKYKVTPKQVLIR
ncbi:MAG: hypothetical protein EX263_09155 [Flavobacteriaceae bacterium]|nr:MAG: hypothetical protein EX263_09155 [Flavobacteriaceae bacterium]